MAQTTLTLVLTAGHPKFMHLHGKILSDNHESDYIYKVKKAVGLVLHQLNPLLIFFSLKKYFQKGHFARLSAVQSCSIGQIHFINHYKQAKKSEAKRTSPCFLSLLLQEEAQGRSFCFFSFISPWI
ncbi:hypothetical protein HA075_11385 [bacterium BFN5]|nr:hypothetical protein HA075_11310 [bacterium BFN5]QJW46377.1 hypothetical protein HA075_11385 [bacterium BFN5]